MTTTDMSYDDQHDDYDDIDDALDNLEFDD